MERYEQPQVQILEFLAKEPVASNVTEPALIDDSISLGTVPSFTEGVEDW